MMLFLGSDSELLFPFSKCGQLPGSQPSATHIALDLS